jgi:transcriptional regulator with XRE-family HTH domain
MANLDDYLRKSGDSQSALAKRAGVSSGTLSSVRSGHRRASPALARKIEAATGGQVRAASLLGLGGETARPPKQLHDGRWVVWTDSDGAALLPAQVLEALGVGPGEAIGLVQTEEGWQIRSVRRDQEGVQERAAKFIQPGRSIVDELIAERRAEAERERRR